MIRDYVPAIVSSRLTLWFLIGREIFANWGFQGYPLQREFWVFLFFQGEVTNISIMGDWYCSLFFYNRRRRRDGRRICCSIYWSMEWNSLSCYIRYCNIIKRERESMKGDAILFSSPTGWLRASTNLQRHPKDTTLRYNVLKLTMRIQYPRIQLTETEYPPRY